METKHLHQKKKDLPKGGGGRQHAGGRTHLRHGLHVIYGNPVSKIVLKRADSLSCLRQNDKVRHGRQKVDTPRRLGENRGNKQTLEGSHLDSQRKQKTIPKVVKISIFPVVCFRRGRSPTKQRIGEIGLKI